MALLLFFILSIAFSFLCSIWEAVLLSVTPSYVNRELEKGTQTGKLLAEYKEDVDRPLSAILTLNTIAHTVGAIGVGAQAGVLYGTSTLDLGAFSLSYESIIAGVMTLCILILSEIIPKTIGANNWESLSPFTVKSIRILLIVLYPLVWMTQLITKKLKKEKGKAVLSRSDFLNMASIGERSGTLGKDESKIIRNILSFQDTAVREIMTPRAVTFMLHEEVSIKDYMEMPQSKVFSRVPVYANDKDDVKGIILKDEVLAAFSSGQEDSIMTGYIRNVGSIQDNQMLPELLEAFSKGREQLKLVKDEYGHTLGVVTMEDMFETLLGREIMDESDKVADLQSVAKESWEAKMKDEPED